MEGLAKIIALQPVHLWGLVVLFLPGFISLKLHQFIERRDPTVTEALIDVIGFSLLNALVLCWPIYIATTNLALPHPRYGPALQNAIWICLVGPISWPVLFQFIKRYALKGGWLVGTERSAFDFAFRGKQTLWVIVHMKDGRLVGGYFGLGSYATAEKDSGHLYLEELWELSDQGKFMNAIPGSMGAIFRPGDYDWIEVFRDGPTKEADVT